MGFLNIGGEFMKKVIFLLLVIFVTSCGYGMKYTKTILPVPPAISNFEIIDVI